jgi:hypothetical protein
MRRLLNSVCRRSASFIFRHCEEQSDEAIQITALENWIASLALAMTGLGTGETGVAKKETEAPPLGFPFSTPAFALHVTVISNSSATARRENGRAWSWSVPMPGSAKQSSV